VCGPGGISGALDLFMKHFQAAHVDTNPVQQVADLLDLGPYIQIHAVLVEGMLGDILGGVDHFLGSFMTHLQFAHLEPNLLQQVADALDLGPYVAVHGALFEDMFHSLLGVPCTPPPPVAVAPPPVVIETPAPTAPPPPGGPTTTVTIKDLAFGPADVKVPTGTMVTWSDADGPPHTVTSSHGGPLKSATLKAGDSYSYTFMAPGTYHYICAVHPNMKGSVVVA
jgi:plastocyanin